MPTSIRIQLILLTVSSLALINLSACGQTMKAVQPLERAAVYTVKASFSGMSYKVWWIGWVARRPLHHVVYIVHAVYAPVCVRSKRGDQFCSLNGDSISNAILLFAFLGVRIPV